MKLWRRAQQQQRHHHHPCCHHTSHTLALSVIRAQVGAAASASGPATESEGNKKIGGKAAAGKGKKRR
jgi:hypothetical protein